jgi:hypothetical protein
VILTSRLKRFDCICYFIPDVTPISTLVRLDVLHDHILLLTIYNCSFLPSPILSVLQRAISGSK